jgi:hypothetical protein
MNKAFLVGALGQHILFTTHDYYGRATCEEGNRKYVIRLLSSIGHLLPHQALLPSIFIKPMVLVLCTLACSFVELLHLKGEANPSHDVCRINLTLNDNASSIIFNYF